MDLSEISYTRALMDVAIANERVLELSMQIDLASSELQILRSEIGKIESPSTSEYVESGQEAAKAHTVRRRKVKLSPVAFIWALGHSIGGVLLQSKAPKKTMLWHVDEIAGSLPDNFNASVVFGSQTRQFTIAGWAIPASRKTAFDTIEVRVVSATAGAMRRSAVRERLDVGIHFGNPALAKSGYRVEFLSSDFPLGLYSIEIGGAKDGEMVGKAEVGKLEIR